MTGDEGGGESLFDSIPQLPRLWSESAERATRRALAGGVPSEGLALFARWWQLETWLRLLLYMELRAARGVRWLNGLSRKGHHLAELDAENAYMPSADSTNLLAYLEAAELLTTIGKHDVWPIVQFALMKRSRWEGLVDELRSIRNRNAHLRRPHQDDLGRVEQALRNLEPGARSAMEAFNRQWALPRDPRDRIARAWIDAEHPDAQRLVEHARDQYDTIFRLRYSRRPWATNGDPSIPVSRRKGVLLHASWFMRGDALITPRSFWGDDYLDLDNTRELIVFVTHPSSSEVSVTFSSADGTTAISDAIGHCFDAALNARERHPTADVRRHWFEDAAGLDWRVQVTSALVEAFEDQPFSVFGA